MKQDYFRDVVHASVGFLSGWICAGLVACASGQSLTPAQAVEIGDTSSQIAHCQIVGREAKSYHAYECCMIGAGLTSGAKCTPAATVILQDAGKDVDSGD